MKDAPAKLARLLSAVHEYLRERFQLPLNIPANFCHYPKMIEHLNIHTTGQGLIEITDEINRLVERADFIEGLATIFVQHTSASLTIQENADPSAKRDLEYWFNKLVAENDPGFTHTYEGPDDMPSHIKSVLSQTSLGVPVVGGRLALGTWQGIYLWEHRKRAHNRRILVHLMG